MMHTERLPIVIALNPKPFSIVSGNVPVDLGHVTNVLLPNCVSGEMMSPMIRQ